LSSGKVDFSGVWQKPYVPDMTKDGTNQKGMPELPFTPWGEADWKKYDAADGDYTGACLPFAKGGHYLKTRLYRDSLWRNT
jgi:hypothetical protein